MAQTRIEYVKHDVELGKEKAKGWLVYGVNASGKSSLMKSVGIAAILAQAGSFVPATTMGIRPYDAAFSRIWSHDNVWAGLSSFAVEVTELRDMLNGATENSLVLGDEVCSGTESLSATSLVASVLEYLDALGAHFIFATHLHDLMKIPGFLPREGIHIWHLRVDRTETGKLIYDRRLQPGPGSSNYGLEVASAMGLPFSIMNRANEIRRSLLGEVAITEAPKSRWNAQIQRKVCEVCGNQIVKDLEVHHIEERAKGGNNTLRNLVVLCETCHDKHHNEEITVGPLRLTTEGEERVIQIQKDTKEIVQENSPEASVVEKQKSGKGSKGSERPEDEMTKIVTIVAKYKGRPLTRTILALEEEGIHMKQAELKRIITKL
jgi:DNA mismatch repair protein MutS